MEAATIRDRVLHIADLHFWRVLWNPARLLNKRALGMLNVAVRRRHEFVMERAEASIDALRATGATTIVMTGDFTSTALDEEFELARRFVDVLLRAGFGLHVLPGNHDAYTFEACRKRRFERWFGDLLPKGAYPARTTLPGGTPLILIPTVGPNLLSSRGRISQEIVERVRELLRECGEGQALVAGQPALVAGQPALVAGHYPLLSRTAGYTLTPSRQLRNALALRKALGDAGRPLVYLCGHVHRFSLTRDPDFPAVLHLSTGAFFADNRREHIQGDFTELHVLRDGVEAFRHVYAGAWESRSAPSVYNGT